MNLGAEGDMPVRPSLEIEILRLFVGLRIRKLAATSIGMIFSPPLQPDAAKQLHILSHEARLGELHWGNEPQEFLDGKLSATPILFQPIAESGLAQQLTNRPADQMRRGFVTGEQEQEQHRHHLVTADAPPFLFDAHKFPTAIQSVTSGAAGLARSLPGAPPCSVSWRKSSERR